MEKTKFLTLYEKYPIQTTRTLLQPMTEKDLNEFLSHTAYSSAVIGTVYEELFIETCKEQLYSETDITFSIRLLNSNMYIGYFELKGIDTEPEIGIDLIEQYQKQGFGFEVCRAVIDYIFEKTDISILKYICFRNNTESIHLAKKLGAIKIKEKILFDTLQAEDIHQSLKDKSKGFDLIIHEIKKTD